MSRGMFTDSNLIINGGTFIHQNHVPPQEPQAVITQGDMNIARMQASYSFEKLAGKAFPLAFHLAGTDRSHSTCFPNTRMKVLDRIQAWALRNAEKDKAIMWLHGAAGGGKTSIARTFANWCDKEQGILLGEFFFSRADGTANQFTSLAPTLAFRMAVHTLKDAKNIISDAISQDPHIFLAPLAHQLTKLVLQPLDNLIPNGITPHVIVLDGLDETLTPDEQEIVLNAISTTVYQHNPTLRILVCSRPEPAIVTIFNDDDSSLKDISVIISLNDDADSDADIRTFLVGRFAKIKKQLPYRPQEEWPTADNINYLVAKSSRQFIFAATVEKYVGSSKHRHLAITRLKHVLDLALVQDPTKSPFADLDALYSLILSTRSDDKLCARAMAVCIQYPDYFGVITPAKLAKVLRMEISEVFATLYELGSLLDVGKDHIKPFHASFGDFLFNKSRSHGLCCVKGQIVADIACSVLGKTPKREVPSYYIFYCLMRDATPCQEMTEALSEMEPDLIFGRYSHSKNPDQGSYYIIPLLKQLEYHLPAQHYQRFVELCENSLITLLDNGGTWTYHTFPSPKYWSATSTYSRKKEAHRRTRNLDISDYWDSSSDSSQTVSDIGNDSPDEWEWDGPDSCRDEACVALLVGSSAWDNVKQLIDISSKGPEALRALCDEVDFVQSHLPRTMAYIRSTSSQTRAAMFCLKQMTFKDVTKHASVAFSTLLPFIISGAEPSTELTTSIWRYINHPDIINSKILSETEEAIIKYLEKVSPKALNEFSSSFRSPSLSRSKLGRTWTFRASGLTISHK